MHNSLLHLLLKSGDFLNTDISQGSIAKHSRTDDVLDYIFITHSAGERVFKIIEHLAKIRAKSLTVSYTPFDLHFCPEIMLISPEIYFKTVFEWLSLA